MTPTHPVIADLVTVDRPTDHVGTGAVERQQRRTVPAAGVAARSASSDAGPAASAEPSAATPDAEPAEAADSIDPDPELDTALQTLDGRGTVADTRLAEPAARLGDVDGRIASTQTELDAVEASGAASAVRVTAAEVRLDATDTATRAARGQIASLTGRLSCVDTRLGAVDDHIATLQHHVADHDRALDDITRSIAAEVERHTSDALVESRHSLQLTVNSIAQLALVMAESSRDITEDVSAESATALLDSFRVDLDAILAQLGFETLGTTVGDAFDPHRHRALRRVPTSDPAQDKAITQVIRDGYVSAGTGRILLFADVEVSRHRA